MATREFLSTVEANPQVIYPQTVILVGAGHVHLYVAAHTQSLVKWGARVVLIDPDQFWYSGLATGMLGGRYSAAADQVDPQRLIEAHGGQFIRDRVAAVDVTARRLRLASGSECEYDYLSFNVGSKVNLDSVSGAADDPSVWSIKPIRNLWKLREHLQSRFAQGDIPSLTVVGGGATGCEVAANVLALAAMHRVRMQVTLLSRSDRLIKQAPSGASRALHQNLSRRGATIRTQCRVAAREPGTLVIAGGERIAADIVVLATGLEANRLMEESGLPTDSANGLRVNANLHSIADRRVFAGGDCAAMEGYQLPKLGVFGVRQATYIHANLLASLQGKSLQSYQPQQRYLAILNLGDGGGLATWGPFWWNGSASMWLKDFIDQRFLTRYRDEGVEVS